jgi:uncharacterized protein YneR
MADRLAIYRAAGRLLGEQRVASLSEVSPTRTAFDDAWRETGDWLLSRGLWNFALRTVELTQDDDIEPLFGYQYAFSKPDDWVRTASISDDGTFREGLRDYSDEADYWYADCDPLYVRYVSDDDEYGWNVGAWRQPFAKAFATRLAFECGLPITGDKSNRNDMEALAERRLKEAKTLDAVDERVQSSPPGRLARSRYGRLGHRSRENG